MTTVLVSQAAVQAEISRYIAGPHDDDPPAALAGAELHNVLPLLNDFMGCWALTTAGRLVFFAWDAPDQLEPVSDRPVDRLGTHAAFAIGSRRYPALAGLAPKRTSGDPACESCDGSGQIPGAPDNMVCACGGLGWLPRSVLGAA
jgi:hypothetical protein